MSSLGDLVASAGSEPLDTPGAGLALALDPGVVDTLRALAADGLETPMTSTAVTPEAGTEELLQR